MLECVAVVIVLCAVVKFKLKTFVKFLINPISTRFTALHVHLTINTGLQTGSFHRPETVKGITLRFADLPKFESEQTIFIVFVNLAIS